MNNLPIIWSTSFQHTILRYEFLKNGYRPREAHKNICEMMISEEIRDEVATKSILIPSESETQPSSSMETLPPKYRTKTMTFGDDVKTSESSTGTSSPISTEATSSEDLKPGIRREKYAEGSGSSSTDSGSTLPYDNQESDCENWEYPPQEITTIYMKKDDEEDIWVDMMPFVIVESAFNRYGDDWLGFEETVEIKFWKVLLSEMRTIAYTYIWLYIGQSTDIQPVHPFNQIKVTLDYGKVKITLQNSDVPPLHIQFWETTGGCWIWHGDTVKLIKNLDYELLAANEFINIIKYSLKPFKTFEFPPNRELESLEFDIAKRTKWDPLEYHKSDFCYKIRKWKMNLDKEEKTRHVIWTRKFRMKVYRHGSKRDHIGPITLKFLMPLNLQEIVLRVWDDSHLTDNHRNIPRYLKNLDDAYQWKMARILDIEDPNLVHFIPKINDFAIVRMFTVLPEGMEMLRNIFNGEPIKKMQIITVKTDLIDEARDFGIQIRGIEKEKDQKGPTWQRRALQLSTIVPFFVVIFAFSGNFGRVFEILKNLNIL